MTIRTSVFLAFSQYILTSSGQTLKFHVRITTCLFQINETTDATCLNELRDRNHPRFVTAYTMSINVCNFTLVSGLSCLFLFMASQLCLCETEKVCRQRAFFKAGEGKYRMMMKLNFHECPTCTVRNHITSNI